MYIPPVEVVLTVDSMLKYQVSIQTSSSLSADPLEHIVHSVFPRTKISVQRVEHSSGHLHHIRFVGLSNGIRLALKSSPPISKNLLRHERRCLENEACTLSVLASSGLPIPKLLMHDAGNKSLGSPFLLTSQLPGICVEKVWAQLKKDERSSIERQIQALGFSIGQHTSRSFGPVLLVSEGKGFATWREAFMFMVASVLSDGEDILVSLPYEEIREQVSNAGPILDKVKEAQLVPVGFDHPKNVLVDPVSKDVTGILDFGRTVWGDFRLVEKGRQDCRGLL